MKTTNEVDRKEIANRMSEAAYRLAACWDVLRDLEDIVKQEVETDNAAIQCLASTCGFPAFRPTVSDSDVDEFLTSLDKE